MQAPSYKGKRIASCVGCAALGLNPTLVGTPCPIWWIAAAI